MDQQPITQASNEASKPANRQTNKQVATQRTHYMHTAQGIPISNEAEHWKPQDLVKSTKAVASTVAKPPQNTLSYASESLPTRWKKHCNPEQRFAQSPPEGQPRSTETNQTKV